MKLQLTYIMNRLPPVPLHRAVTMLFAVSKTMLELVNAYQITLVTHTKVVAQNVF